MMIPLRAINAFLVIGIGFLAAVSEAHAQISRNDSSSATSTVCMNNQPCHTMICDQDRQCSVFASPNIESSESFPGDMGGIDILDEYD